MNQYKISILKIWHVKSGSQGGKLDQIVFHLRTWPVTIYILATYHPAQFDLLKTLWFLSIIYFQGLVVKSCYRHDVHNASLKYSAPTSHPLQCYSWGGAMGHRPIQQKNGTLTTEIAILNLERMAHWNFTFIGNKWKMANTMVCPATTLH